MDHPRPPNFRDIVKRLKDIPSDSDIARIDTQTDADGVHLFLTPTPRQGGGTSPSSREMEQLYKTALVADTLALPIHTVSGQYLQSPKLRFQKKDGRRYSTTLSWAQAQRIDQKLQTLSRRPSTPTNPFAMPEPATDNLKLIQSLRTNLKRSQVGIEIPKQEILTDPWTGNVTVVFSGKNPQQTRRILRQIMPTIVLQQIQGISPSSFRATITFQPSFDKDFQSFVRTIRPRFLAQDIQITNQGLEPSAAIGCLKCTSPQTITSQKIRRLLQVPPSAIQRIQRIQPTQYVVEINLRRLSSPPTP